MPVRQSRSEEAWRLLVKPLADELRRPTSSGEPAVYEDSIGQTGVYHVLVIWERWNGIDTSDRVRAISGAYELSAPEKASKLSVALGLTRAEAIDLELLPFGIFSIADPSEVSRGRVRKALKAAGGVPTEHGFQLRFRTLEEARSAYRQLQETLPGPYWALIQR